MTISELCARHQRIALDANVLIYLVEDSDILADVAQALIDAVEGGRTVAVLAGIGLAEVCAGPATRGDLALVERYAEVLASIPGLRIQLLTADIAVDAAVIRGMRGIGLPDALHLASARAAGATAFVTNDRRLRGSSRLDVIYLDELAVA
ncbi:MAG: PIN domain-containing protein [Candidatus Limnocylindrales bacterium]